MSIYHCLLLYIYPNILEHNPRDHDTADIKCWANIIDLLIYRFRQIKTYQKLKQDHFSWTLMSSFKWILTIIVNEDICYVLHTN